MGSYCRGTPSCICAALVPVGLPQLLHLHEWSPLSIIVDLFCAAHHRHGVWCVSNMLDSIVESDDVGFSVGEKKSSSASDGRSTSWAGVMTPKKIKDMSLIIYQWKRLLLFFSQTEQPTFKWLLPLIDKNDIMELRTKLGLKLLPPPLSYFSIQKKHSYGFLWCNEGV